MSGALRASFDGGADASGRGSIRVACVLATLLVVSLPALAQTGGMLIEVFDAESREPVPGATCQVTSEQGLIPPTRLLSDAEGRCLFPVLRTGSGYTVEVSMPGFGAQRHDDLRVRTGETLPLRVILSRPTEERVQVVGQRDIVDIDQVGSSTKFSAEFIETLPQLGRLYQDVLPLAPGVNDDDGDGNPNVHGSRSRDFRAEIGGVSNVDPLSGQWLSYVNVDSIEELEVLPTGAGVEFGRAQGGFARVVQKQGGNEFEGVFNFLYRSSDLDGEGASDTSALPASEFESMQPSIQLSGPIIKDKLWYRLSHEYVRQEDPLNLLTSVEVRTLEQTINADQITWQVSPRNKLALQWQYDPLKIDNLGISTSVPAESSRTFERGGTTWSLSWVAPVSEKILVDTLFAYQDHSFDFVPTTAGAGQDCFLSYFIEIFNVTRCRNLSRNRTSGSHNETSLDDRQRLSVQSQATFYSRIAGDSHQFKLGFKVENERYFRELERAPDMNFEVVDTGIGDPFGIATVNMFAPGASSARATGNSWAIYAEDQWRPANGLSITLGLRFDREEIDARGYEPFDAQAEAEEFQARLADEPIGEVLRTSFTAHENINEFRRELAQALGMNENNLRMGASLVQPSSWNKKRRQEDIHLVNDNFSPRLNLAWDPWADGKTKVSVSAGRYYDKIFLAVPLVELEPLETQSSFGTPIPFWPDLPQVFSLLDNEINISPLTIHSVDRDLSTPYQDEFTVGFERQIWAETALSVRYVRRKYRDQLQDVDVNHATGDFGRCSRTLIFEGDAIRPPVWQGFVVTSEGEGQTLTDPFSGEHYVDTDAGPGDGVLDDCVGELDYVQQSFDLVDGYDVADGRPDLYVQNPAWEEILLLGNSNRSDYRAFIVELVRRMYRDWQFEGSYTWSEVEGDAEDFDLLLGNEANLKEDEAGFLDYDQRHVVKFHAIWRPASGWRVGTNISWQSGLPYSILDPQPVGYSTPPSYPFSRTSALRQRLRYPTGQRNDQRNESYWNVDLLLAKDLRISRRTHLQLSAEAFNLFDDDTLQLENITSAQVSGTRRFGRRYQLGLRLGF